MTKDELDEIKRKRLALETPPPTHKQAVERPSLWEEIKRGAARGVVTGPTSLADVVGLGAEAGVKAAGAPQDLQLPSMTQVAEHGLNLPEVTTSMGRIAEGVSGGATLGVPGGPAGIGLGAVAGGLGAIGVETAKLFTDNPWIQAAAGLAGGISAGAAMRGIEAGVKVAGSLHPTIRRGVLKNQMERMLAGQIPDMNAAMKKGQEALALAKKTPGFEPSISEIVPSAQSASKILRRSDAAISARQNLRQEQNIEALVKKADDLAKHLPVGTPESARAALRNRQEVMQQVAQSKVDKTHEDFNDALRPIRELVGDQPNPAEFGGKIRDRVKTTFEAQKANFDDRYRQLSLGVAIDPSKSVNALQTLEKTVKKAEVDDLPSIYLRDILRNLGRQKVPIGQGQTALGPRGKEPLDEVIAVRSRLLTEIMQEQAAPAPNANKIRLSTQLLDGIQQNIDEAIANTPNAALTQINADYKAFMQKFKSDPIKNVLAVTRQGVEKRSDRAIFQEFSNLSAGKGADQFKALQEAIGTEEARAIYGEAVMAKMMLSPGIRHADGTYNPKAVQKFLDVHAPLMRELPDLQRQMQGLKAAADESVKAPKKIPTLADFDSTVARQLMGDYPDEAIKLIVKSGNMTDALSNLKQAFGGQPAVERAMSRSLWNALIDEAGIVRPSATTTADLAVGRDGNTAIGLMLQRHEKPLRAFYGDDAYDGLVEIQKAAKLTAESPRRIDPGYSQEKHDFAGIVKTMWSRAFGVARGVIGPQFTSAELFTRRIANLVDAFDEKETRIIMDNLLHDKDLIGILTRVKNAKEIIEAKRGLKRWLKTNMIPTVGVTGQQLDVQQSK